MSNIFDFNEITYIIAVVVMIIIVSVVIVMNLMPYLSQSQKIIIAFTVSIVIMFIGYFMDYLNTRYLSITVLMLLGLIFFVKKEIGVSI